MKKNLYFIILATSSYNKYLDFFFKSLNNFKLSEFNLNIIVASDEIPKFDKYDLSNYDKKLYYPIAHAPYPFIAYLKTFTIKNILNYFKIKDDEYFLYVDADTIIRKMDSYDFLKNYLLSNKLFFNISSWSLNDEYYGENELNHNDIFKLLYIENFQREDFLQTSFFGGIVREYENFNNMCYNLITEFSKDWKHKYMPPMIDQAIITKIVNSNKHLYNKDYFCFNYYGEFNENEIYNKNLNFSNEYFTYDNDKLSSVFLLQKWNFYKYDIRISIT